MDIRTTFSNYLKSADIDSAGGAVKFRIRAVKMEKMKDKHGDEEQKPVMYFGGTEKGLVLNKTNANRVMAAFGPETDDWTGKVLELYVESVEAFGSMQDAIRVRVPKPAAPAKPAPRRQTEVIQSDEPVEDIDGPEAFD